MRGSRASTLIFRRCMLVQANLCVLARVLVIVYLWMVAGSVRPGCGPPDRRPTPPPIAAKVQEQLRLALFENGCTIDDIHKKIPHGSHGEDPFPPEALLAAREGVTNVVWQQWKEWSPSGEPPVQNIQVRLLGVLLKTLDDPDWEIMHDYERGVRLGVWITMPRTPLTYPDKVRWRIPGQSEAK